MDSSLELVKRAQAGDQRAFKGLVEAHNSQVYGQILRMMRNPEDAKEVAQLTWIKVWRKLDGFRFESAFSSWLYRVATFTALDAIRKRNNLRESTFEGEIGEQADADGGWESHSSPQQFHQLEREEIRERFDQAIEKLPAAQKETLLLREREGLSYKEISERMDCKIGTVMSRIFSARRSLQVDLKDFLP